jgi:hypothetical protein
MEHDSVFFKGSLCGEKDSYHGVTLLGRVHRSHREGQYEREPAAETWMNCGTVQLVDASRCRNCCERSRRPEW